MRVQELPALGQSRRLQLPMQRGIHWTGMGIEWPRLVCHWSARPTLALRVFILVFSQRGVGVRPRMISDGPLWSFFGVLWHPKRYKKTATFHPVHCNVPQLKPFRLDVGVPPCF
jgi:hypothetical protein